MATTNILVLGRTGQVGRELLRAPAPSGFALTGPAHDYLDVTDRDGVARAIFASDCALVVNAAAYTAVDKAESEPAAAFGTNHDAPKFIAEACSGHGIPMIHISTDYVFDGTKAEPYLEGDPVAPLGVYGASKEAGERAVRDVLDHHVIVRTSWIFSAHGHNFVKTMLRLGAVRRELQVVDDQIGRPTAAGDLALSILEIARQILIEGRTDGWGTFHFAGDGPTSWFGFAQAVFESRKTLIGNESPRVEPIATADHHTAARRPANSVLDCAKIQKIYRVRPRHWQSGLSAVVAELLRDGT